MHLADLCAAFETTRSMCYLAFDSTNLAELSEASIIKVSLWESCFDPRYVVPDFASNTLILVLLTSIEYYL